MPGLRQFVVATKLQSFKFYSRLTFAKYQNHYSLEGCGNTVPMHRDHNLFAFLQCVPLKPTKWMRKFHEERSNAQQTERFVPCFLDSKAQNP